MKKTRKGGANMKKNLLSVVILALVLANFVLTAILMFTMYPQAKNANKMIEAVCQAIDLELSSGAGSGIANVPQKYVEEYVLNEGESMTINLAKGEDDKQHFAVLKVALSLNNNSEGYKEYGTAELSGKENYIMDIVNEVVHKYTKEEFDADTKKVKAEILDELQSVYGADFIIGVNFSKVNTD